jgi:hypothetical protein
MAGLAASGVDPMDVAIMKALQDPSLDELWDCVQYIHNPEHPPQPIYPGENCQIEEIRTRRALRMEVLKLHVGFFSGAESPNSAPTLPIKA